MAKKIITKGDLTPVEKRFSDAAINIRQQEPESDDIGFMQAGLCHVFFPYANPGDADLWVREHGKYTLTMEATRELNPDTRQMERFGLPFGAKPRMMLALLNTIAIKQQSPELHLGNSLTEFVGKYLEMNTGGRNIIAVKNQLARLASADIKIHYKIGENSTHSHSARQRVNIINDLDIWWSKTPNQRHFWGNNLRFSDDYYNALVKHGVPLDLRALRAISTKPIAIDLYSFLAHRLHVLNKPLFITWAAMKGQFGYNYKNMHHFKAEFRLCLNMVKTVYPKATIHEDDNKGFILYPSHPPISKTTIATPKKEYIILPNNAPIEHPKRIAKATPKGGQKDSMKSVGEALNGLWETIQKEEQPSSKPSKKNNK